MHGSVHGCGLRPIDSVEHGWYCAGLDLDLEWKSPRGTSPAATSIRQTLRQLDADLACLTETQPGWLPDGHEASGLPDTRQPARRKVVL